MTKKAATRDFVFHFCKIKKVSFQNIDNIFPTKQKKNVGKTSCGRPTGHIYGHPLDSKQTFLCGQPNKCIGETVQCSAKPKVQGSIPCPFSYHLGLDHGSCISLQKRSTTSNRLWISMTWSTLLVLKLRRETDA